MMKKSKLWIPVLTVVALAAASGSVMAATTNAPATSAPSAQHQQDGKHFGHRGHGNFELHGQALLTLLNIDAKTLQQDLHNGQSLADIAAAKNVPEQKVIDLLVSKETAKLDQAIKAGKLTQDKADKIKADLATRVKKQVESKHTAQADGKKFGHRHGHDKGMFGFGFQQDQAALLKLLNIDAATLKQDLRSGQSLADIAASKNVTEQQVIDLLVNNATQKLDQAVKAGKLTQDKADKIKATMTTHIKKMVEQKHTARTGKDHKDTN